MDKKQSLTPVARDHVIKYLFTLAQLLRAAHIKAEHTAPSHTDMRRIVRENAVDYARGRWAKGGSRPDEAWRWKALEHFLDHSFSAVDKRDHLNIGDVTCLTDDSFSGAFDFLTASTTTRAMLNEYIGVTHVEKMERAGDVEAGSARKTVYSLYKREGMRKATDEEVKSGKVTHDVGSWTAMGREAVEKIDDAVRTAQEKDPHSDGDGDVIHCPEDRRSLRE